MTTDSAPSLPRLGLGIGWRPEFARAIELRPGIGFVEIVAENFPQALPIPQPVELLRERGLFVIPHGISLSLGGAEQVDPQRVRRLDELARQLSSPLVSEHIAFVRSGDIEAGHLLPVPRTRPVLEVLIENVRRAQDLLSVPLALENISTLFDWPANEIPESEFVTELLDRTGAFLLLDVANVYANARNLGGDPMTTIERLPLHRLAYVHMGGGYEKDGVYHDTHAHPVPAGAIDLLAQLCKSVEPPGVMLERDDHFPSVEELQNELDTIEAAMRSARVVEVNK
jgi:uncharacterized protein (UPF0276 family)